MWPSACQRRSASVSDCDKTAPVHPTLPFAHTPLLPTTAGASLREPKDEVRRRWGIGIPSSRETQRVQVEREGWRPFDCVGSSGGQSTGTEPSRRSGTN